MGRKGGVPYPIKTLNAPSGVTRIAGANAYAAKFALSLNATAILSQSGRFLIQEPSSLADIVPVKLTLKSAFEFATFVSHQRGSDAKPRTSIWIKDECNDSLPTVYRTT